MRRNRPDEGFGAEKESMVSLDSPRRRTSPKVSPVEEWWRMGQEAGAVEPTQVDPGVEGARFAFRWSGADGNGGSEGEGNEPTPTDTRYGKLAISTWSGRRRWKGSILG